MNYLKNFFQSLKQKGFFVPFLENNQPKEYVSPYASLIPVITEEELNQKEYEKSYEALVRDCQKYKVVENNMYMPDLTITLPFLKSVFCDVVNLENPDVKSYLYDLRKRIADADSMTPRTSFHPFTLSDVDGQRSECFKLKEFFKEARIVTHVDEEPRWGATFSADLYITDLRAMRLNQQKEKFYERANRGSDEVFDGSKLEDVLRGHYKIKKIPSIYEDIIENNNLGWKVLTNRESSVFGKHLRMAQAEGIIEKSGMCIRVNKQKTLNTWLSNPEARVYQAVKPNLEILEKKYISSLHEEARSKNDDLELKTSARKTLRSEKKTAYRLHK